MVDFNKHRTGGNKETNSENEQHDNKCTYETENKKVT